MTQSHPWPTSEHARMLLDIFVVVGSGSQAFWSRAEDYCYRNRPYSFKALDPVCVCIHTFQNILNTLFLSRCFAARVRLSYSDADCYLIAHSDYLFAVA